MEKFIELLKETLEIEDRDVLPQDAFREYEEWDSLAVLSLVAMINEEYDITIPRNEFDKLSTIDDLYKKIIEMKG